MSASIVGLIQSYSINYSMFVICEIMCAIAVCPIFTCALVLGLEWAGSRERVMINSLINFPVHIGTATVGFIAFLVRDFRFLLRYVYGPCLLVGCLMFFGPESFRWLLANGKRQQIEQILNRATQINNREISARTREILNRKYAEATTQQHIDDGNKIHDERPYRTLFSSRTFISRLCISSLCWITGNYISQGITVMAVTLKGNKYHNFIVLGLGAAPACFLSLLVLRFCGRRTGIAACLLISSTTVILAKMLPTEYSGLSLALLLCARSIAMVAYLIVYVHTSEIWPTNVRHSMVGLSSTFGRFGSILAPLTPLLVS